MHVYLNLVLYLTLSMIIKRLSHFTNFVFFLAISITGLSLVHADSSQSSINFSAINKYAIFSSLAYKNKPSTNEAISLKDYTITHYSNISGFNISYLLATNDLNKSQVIAVRGTSNIENALVDIALELTTDKHTGIRLHNGFSQTARAIYAEIKPKIKADYAISTTGHSLGGAVALILAMYLDTDNYKVDQIVTFGQPKVTNIAGTNKFEHLNILRVVTPKDLVPLVPPFDPVDINNLDIYWHPGKEVILLADTDYAVTGGIESMMRAIKFTQEPLTKDNLKNHEMSLYLKLIAQKISSSKLVEFESSFNLFNLFGSE